MHAYIVATATDQDVSTTGYSKDHYGHTVPSGGEPTGYNVPQGAVGPPHHKGDIHRGAGRPPNIEDISEYVDISRKDYIMSPEYKERKRKEFEEKQKREEDERRQKELYDDGFFFMSWLRVRAISVCACMYVSECMYM